MKKECYCPICHQMTRSGKVRWLWFWIFLLIFTSLWPIYLLYCLLTPKRICERCKNRIKFYTDISEWEADDHVR